jgi:hypothetical protein
MFALLLALPRAGSSSAARMAIIAMTTSSSIKVNPPRPLVLVILKRLIIDCFDGVVISVNFVYLQTASQLLSYSQESVVSSDFA